MVLLKHIHENRSRCRNIQTFKTTHFYSGDFITQLQQIPYRLLFSPFLKEWIVEDWFLKP